MRYKLTDAQLRCLMKAARYRSIYAIGSDAMVCKSLVKRGLMHKDSDGCYHTTAEGRTYL